MVDHNVNVSGAVGATGEVAPPADPEALAVEMWTVRPTFVEAVVYDGTNGEAVSKWCGFYPDGWLPTVEVGDAFVRDTSGTVEHVSVLAVDARFERVVPDPEPLSDIEVLALGGVFVRTDEEVQAALGMARAGTVALFVTDNPTTDPVDSQAPPKGYLPLNDFEQRQLHDAVLTVYGDDFTDDDTLAMSVVVGEAMRGGHKVWG